VYEDEMGLVLSPTDLTKHLACGHLTTLDLQVLRGELGPPRHVDEALELIFRLGLEHEKAYLAKLRASSRAVVEIPESAELSARVQLTDDAVHAGADVVYQATFLDHGHRGSADFLLRVNRPSLLGSHSYDVADTKLARKMKVAALLQMADYGRHLQRLQGQPPEWLTVVTGDGQERRFRYADAAAYARRATRQLRAAIEHPVPTRPEPVSHCGQCRWSARCEAQWRREDHLSLVAFMRGDHRHALEQAGARTVAELAASDPEQLPLTIGQPSRVRLQAQAALQVLERQTKAPHYELLAPEQFWWVSPPTVVTKSPGGDPTRSHPLVKRAQIAHVEKPMMAWPWSSTATQSNGRHDSATGTLVPSLRGAELLHAEPL
jgi:predicted RecB family nuclease